MNMQLAKGKWETSGPNCSQTASGWDAQGLADLQKEVLENERSGLGL